MEMTRRWFLGTAAAAAGATFFDLGVSWQKHATSGIWVPVSMDGGRIAVWLSAEDLTLSTHGRVVEARSGNVAMMVDPQTARELWNGGAGWKARV